MYIEAIVPKFFKIDFCMMIKMNLILPIDVYNIIAEYIDNPAVWRRFNLACKTFNIICKKFEESKKLQFMINNRLPNGQLHGSFTDLSPVGKKSYNYSEGVKHGEYKYSNNGNIRNSVKNYHYGVLHGEAINVGIFDKSYYYYGLLHGEATLKYNDYLIVATYSFGIIVSILIYSTIDEYENAIHSIIYHNGTTKIICIRTKDNELRNYVNKHFIRPFYFTAGDSSRDIYHKNSECIDEVIDYFDGVRSGRYTKYQPYGLMLREQCTYVNGKIEGEYTKWYENGKLRYKAEYVSGVEHGEVKRWNIDGKLIYHRIHKDGQRYYV
jgi:antitoxin component YwqK of YwqJK toxin-antitoxin module